MLTPGTLKPEQGSQVPAVPPVGGGLGSLASTAAGPLPQVPARPEPVAAALPDARLDLLGGADRKGGGAREGNEAAGHDAGHGARQRSAVARLVPQLPGALPPQRGAARAGAQGGPTTALPRAEGAPRKPGSLPEPYLPLAARGRPSL